jgi:type VI secretion system secreted protein VgrG
MPVVELSFASGEASLSARSFRVEQGLSRPFSAKVVARSPHQIDLESIVGRPAALEIVNDPPFMQAPARRWAGVCQQIEQVRAEPAGLQTYELTIVPSLWLLTQRRGYRIFQHRTIPEIVARVLSAWSIDPVWSIDRSRYPKLWYKAQYGESDLAFVGRLLEEAGIAFTFATGRGGDGAPIFADALHAGTARDPALPWFDSPSDAADREHVTDLVLSHEVRPGAYTIRDHDLRNPAFPLFGETRGPGDVEARLEQYVYDPGAFVVEGGREGETPVADDKGAARAEAEEGRARAERFLLAERAGRRAVSLRTNAMDVSPGALIAVSGHPHGDLGSAPPLLVTEEVFEGSIGGEWARRARAVFADTPYRPPLVTPKPVVEGVQSATVVGPPGQEIHTDEFGRVRVQFPWDREGKSDDESSCWVRVSQGWAGTGFGLITIPRVGQEVLVGFLEGDPDQPIVVGRVFNAANPLPYKLPDHRTRSTWKSRSSPGSDGFNELMFEDLAGRELVWTQAEKDLRKLVKNDETITVGGDRQKLVKGNETEVVDGDRTEVTHGDRTELTRKDRTTVVEGTRRELVRGDDVERVERDRLLYVGGDQHLVVDGVKRERVERDSHLLVKGDRNEQVGGSYGLSAGSHEIACGSQAVGAGGTIHLKAGASIVVEAPDVTIKGPGGFVRVDASGVTIAGAIVYINSGGSAGVGPGGGGGKPEKPKEAKVEEPPAPVVDDVSKTRLGPGR